MLTTMLRVEGQSTNIGRCKTIMGRRSDGSRYLYGFVICLEKKADVKKALELANYVRRHCTSVILFND